MSNHFSAAMLKFPGDDGRLDLTDLFVFTGWTHSIEANATLLAFLGAEVAVAPGAMAR